MTRLFRLALAAPLALALAACGQDTDPAETSAEPVAAVAAPAGTTWRDTVTVTPAGGYLMGNPEAPIKLVEYGSLTCPACAAFSMEGSQDLQEEYVDTGKVSYEFRSVLIHGTVDLVLTRLLQCAAPEAAIPLADQLWGNLGAVLDPLQANGAAAEAALQLPENQRFVAFAEAAGLFDYFAQRGLSEDQARQCLSDFSAIEKLAEQRQAQSQQDAITQTPTFLVNGRTIDANRWAEVEAVLQRAGAK